MADLKRPDGAYIEESAEELYDNAPCGYFSTLPDGTFVRVNRTFLAWTGYEREELVGKRRFQELLNIGGKIFYETHIAPLLQMQGAVNEIQLDLVAKNGRPVPALINTVARRDEAGRASLLRTTAFNISERKRYEEELRIARRKAEQAAQARSEFLSMMSHEIRTPMSAIIGIAGLLRRTELTAQQQKYVRILQSSSENLLQLLNDILDLSKLEAGKAALEEQPFDLRQSVYSSIYTLSGKAEEKQLELAADIDEAIPQFVAGDSLKLGQVLTNLVSNAIKFTERGSVSVSLRAVEQFEDAVSVEFKVIDTGIGIPPDRLAQIFEEFTQASSEIGVKYGGTGLGLAISRRLVEIHGGKLAVTSTQGEGSTFYFTVRFRKAQALPADGADHGDNSATLRGVRALLVEDNAINVFMVSHLLKGWGLVFDVVGDGRQALERVQRNDYDIILMDLRMPEMDGYAAIRAIRSLPGEKFRALPVVAVTASSRFELRERMEAHGFTDFLAKPFRPEVLFEKLVRHVEHSRNPA